MVTKFCNDMENVPVGVIVGLFQAMSTKLPSFSEWDSRKYSIICDNNPAVCEAMEEVKSHIVRHGMLVQTYGGVEADQ